MKYAFLIIFLGMFSSCKAIDYSGYWIYAGESFENIMILEKIEGKENTYKFSFNAWRISFDYFANQDMKFPGTMHNEECIIEIKNNIAFYSDDVLVFDEEFPLYHEGEERCKVYFTFTKDSVSVQTEDCHLIYGGYGVLFDGDYKKS